VPAELLYDDVGNLLEQLKALAERSEECRIKVNKKNVKLKVRTKRRLYTAVLTPEKTGVSLENLLSKAQELASQAGCKNTVVID